MFSVSPLCSCSYRMMQSCWALDSRKRPSFSWLVSSLACQLAEAEGAVSKHRKKKNGVLFVALHKLRNILLIFIQVCHCLMELFPRDLYKSLGKFFVPSERILTSLMRISFLLLSAPGLWNAEISQLVLWECASLVQEPAQLTLVVPWEGS